MLDPLISMVFCCEYSCENDCDFGVCTSKLNPCGNKNVTILNIESTAKTENAALVMGFKIIKISKYEGDRQND